MDPMGSLGCELFAIFSAESLRKDTQERWLARLVVPTKQHAKVWPTQV